MPAMTKAQHAKHAKLLAALHGARDRVYAAGPNRDTRFSECFALASETTRREHETALAAVDAFERDMIAACRAYRGTFGTFTPY